MNWAEEHPWLCAGVVLALFVAFIAGETVGFRLGQRSACRDWSACERIDVVEVP